MKKNILMLIAFSIVVAALVGCQQKTENNPPVATNEATDQGASGATVPGNATWNNTNSSPMPTNPASTNGPAGTNQ